MNQPNLIIPLACTSCGAFLATAVNFPDRGLFLHVPPFLIREGRSTCSICKQTFHWNGHHMTVEGVRKMRYSPVDKSG